MDYVPNLYVLNGKERLEEYEIHRNSTGGCPRVTEQAGSLSPSLSCLLSTSFLFS